MDAEPVKTSRRTRAVPSASVAEGYGVPETIVAKRSFMSALSLWCYRRRYTLIPFVILLFALGYYYHQYRHLLVQTKPAVNTTAQVQKAVADVEKLMYVKDDSGAQLATITDTTKLSGQKFFANAKNGDELVLFPASQQAVLYRPSIGKIIEVGPFTPQTTSSAKGAVPASPFRPASTTSSSTKTR